MKTFTDYVIQNHPDPDSVYYANSGRWTDRLQSRWDQIDKLAQAYAEQEMVKFAKFVDDAGFVPKPDCVWLNFEAAIELTDAELLQKYREQNK